MLASASRVHHDGSPLYVSTLSPRLGETLTLRLRTHRDQQPETVALRTVRDGEPHIVVAEAKETIGDVVWWVAHVVVRNVETHYRWLLAGGAFDFAWLTAGGLVDYEVPDATDFVVSATEPPPGWAHSSVVYQVFPDRFARSQADDHAAATPPEGVELPAWAVPRAWTDKPEGRSPSTAKEYFGGDLDGVRAHLDHIAALGADVVYLTPVFPAESTHRYDASSFDMVDPLLGGDAALVRLVDSAHDAGLRVLGDITLNHCGRAHEWFLRAQDPAAPEREFFRFDPDLHVRLRMLVQRADAAEVRSHELAPARGARAGRAFTRAVMAAGRLGPRRLAGGRREHGRPHGVDRRDARLRQGRPRGHGPRRR